MILEQVLQTIPSEIVVKQILNLSELKTSADLYHALASLKENVFVGNTRIIFYHSEPFVYSFNELPADSLINLQKMLSYIDIPNFFCLMISNNVNIKSELDYVCQWHAVNDQPISYILIE